MGVYDIAIAHRGLHSDTVSENSMKAFELAVEAGYNIELDVHRLKDGKIVVFHDDNVKRMIPSKDCKLCDLSAEDIDGNEFLLPDGQHIPYFQDVLDLVNGKINIVCELKNINPFDYKLEKAIVEMIKDKPWVVMESFNPCTVAYFKKHAPHIVRGQLASSKLFNKVPFAFVHLNKLIPSFAITKPHFVAYNIKDLPLKALDYQCKKRNIKLVVWTVKTEADYKKAQELGAEAVIFDNIRPNLAYSPTKKI